MIQLQTLVENDCVAISLDKGKSLLKTTWLGQPSSEYFRKYISALTAKAIEHQIPYVLFDVRQRNYIEFSDQNWLIDEIFPQLKGVLRKAAYLTEFESFKLFDTLRLQEAMAACKQAKSFKIEHFLDEKQAIDWLLA